MPITRLNHAVLFVRDVDRASAFYRDAFGFEEIERPAGMRAAFMRSPTGGNHHDLGLFEVGPAATKWRCCAGRCTAPICSPRIGWCWRVGTAAAPTTKSPPDLPLAGE